MKEQPMMTWLKQPRRPRRPLAPPFRPSLETLENRCLPAGNVVQTNLVSDLPGVARTLDPHLVNPWGIAESGSSPFWVSDNGTGVSTLYNTAGTPQSLVVNIPGPPPANPLGTDGTPTGAVFNTFGGPNGGFKVAANGQGPAAPAFLFGTEDGTIAGWAPSVDGTHAVIAVNNSAAGAIYKGLAIAGNGTTQLIAGDPDSKALLYAANFSAGKIEVFDPDFSAAKTAAGAFTDPNLPRGYAPFNVQVLTVNGTPRLFVTYAKQDAAKEDEVDGAGFGFVDVYNLDGTGGQRLVSRGDLNAPWGLAIAPTASTTSDFGTLSGALLVGNFGDGSIHAYNATTGAPLGRLVDPDGEPVIIHGLWALQAGNGGNGGDKGTIYFTAGLDHENHGLFGSLAGVAPGAESDAETLVERQTVQAAIDVAQLDTIAVINDITNHASRDMLRQDFRALKTALRDLRHAEFTYFIDNHMIYQGSTDQGGATLQTLATSLHQLAVLLGRDGDNDQGDDDD
jgi:uncharacterized protein (TIGR03118 family)